MKLVRFFLSFPDSLYVHSLSIRNPVLYAVKDFIAMPKLNRKGKSQKLERESVNEVGWFRLQCFVLLVFMLSG